jgi:UDP:flavonoid glycosyltransferase YjiC (YdhE family)
MKILFITTGSQVTVYAVAPFATAVRNAGHEVLLAANEPLMQYVEAIEVPAVSVATEPIRHFLMAGRSEDGRTAPRDVQEENLDFGRGFAKMGSAELDPLLALAGDWSPDLIVGGSMSYAAGLLAASLKVPYVRQIEYLRVPTPGVDPVAKEGLRPELGRLGLAGFPEPDLLIDACPPSLQPSPSPAQPMRWIPRNPQRRLEPWMYTRPKGRPRVLITSGTHFRMLSGSSMRYLTDFLTRLGAEVLIAAPEKTAQELGAELGDVRIGWIPLDVVASTCDLAVHHGGATTSMTVMTAGVPQLITPPNSHTKAIAEALSSFGAALALGQQRQEPGQDPAEAIAAGCQEILATPRYTQQAQALAQEIATLPPPSEIVHTIEAL